MFTLLVVVELIVDKRPDAPARTAPSGPDIARIVLGGAWPPDARAQCATLELAPDSDPAEIILRVQSVVSAIQ